MSFGRELPITQLLGVRFHSLTFFQAVEIAEEWMGGSRPHYAVTPNPEIVVSAQSDPDLREAIRQAHLSLPDGVALLWAARKLGVPLLEKISGIDFSEKLFEGGSSRGIRVFLLGGEPSVAEMAAQRLSARYPGLQVVGTYHGYFSTSDLNLVIQKIRQSKPSLLLLGIGFPRQELFAYRHYGELEVPLLLTVGGSLDVWSGRVRRAPRWIQGVGAEWIYRLLRQLWRWRRQQALLRFIRLVLQSPRQSI